MKIIKNKLPLLAMLTALTVVLAIFFVIPVPMTKGYVNFLEIGIYTTAMLFGGPAGLIVGALSGGMLDLILGYPQWLLFSAIIHGVQGYIAGKSIGNQSWSSRITWLTLSSVVMVVGYFFAGAFLYGMVASLASIPANIMQVIFGTIGSLLIVKVLDNNPIVKKIQQ